MAVTGGSGMMARQQALGKIKQSNKEKLDAMRQRGREQISGDISGAAGQIGRMQKEADSMVRQEGQAKKWAAGQKQAATKRLGAAAEQARLASQGQEGVAQFLQKQDPTMDARRAAANAMFMGGSSFGGFGKDIEAARGQLSKFDVEDIAQQAGQRHQQRVAARKAAVDAQIAKDYDAKKKAEAAKTAEIAEKKARQAGLDRMSSFMSRGFGSGGTGQTLQEYTDDYVLGKVREGLKEQGVKAGAGIRRPSQVAKDAASGWDPRQQFEQDWD